MGSSCSRVMTVDFPSLSYIKIGMFGYGIGWSIAHAIGIQPQDSIPHKTLE